MRGASQGVMDLSTNHLKWSQISDASFKYDIQGMNTCILVVCSKAHSIRNLRANQDLKQ